METSLTTLLQTYKKLKTDRILYFTLKATVEDGIIIYRLKSSIYVSPPQI